MKKVKPGDCPGSNTSESQAKVLALVFLTLKQMLKTTGLSSSWRPKNSFVLELMKRSEVNIIVKRNRAIIYRGKCNISGVLIILCCSG